MVDIVIRVLGGTNRGRKLRSPKGLLFRPTTGRVKEFIFSFIGDWIEGISVLDLFAGSGAFGFECLSRGAELVVFIDNNKQSIESLKRTTELFDLENNNQIIQINAYKIEEFEINIKFDLIFIDPPYENDKNFEIDKLIETINKKGLIVFKHQPKYTFPSLKKFKIIDQRTYGMNAITFLAPKS